MAIQLGSAYGKVTIDASGVEPAEAWADIYWKTLMKARTLQGDRAQALKDYAEYKDRFREQADITGAERILIGI